MYNFGLKLCYGNTENGNPEKEIIFIFKMNVSASNV